MDPSEEVLYTLSGKLDFVKEWFMSFSPVLGTVLVAAAGIYLAFIGWRAFRAATNKV